MLRSSREGRKKAARYHLISDKANHPAPAKQVGRVPSPFTISPSSFYQNRKNINHSSTVPSPLQSHTQYMTRHEAQTLKPQRYDSHIDAPEQSIAPTSSQVTLKAKYAAAKKEHPLPSDSVGNVILPTTLVNNIPISQRNDNTASAVANSLAPSEAPTSASATGTHITRSSRETSLDSHSDGTNFTSPPPTHTPSDVENHGNSWTKYRDVSGEVINGLSDKNNPLAEPVTYKGSTRRIDYHEQDSYAEDTLLSKRPKRTAKKSLRQLEAEENEIARLPRRSSTHDFSEGSVPADPGLSLVGAAKSIVKEEIETGDRTISRKRPRGRPPKDPEARAKKWSLMEEPVTVNGQSGTSLVKDTTKIEGGVKRGRGRPKGSTKSAMLARRKAEAEYLTVRQSGATDGHGTSSGLSPSDCNTARSKRSTWRRKIYLTSGLYSDEHKMTPSDLGKPATPSRSSEQPVLPLPTDHGYWLLTQERDFRLPFPLSQEIGEVREKLAAKRRPPPYKYISKNRYVSRPKLPGEIMVCQCPANGTCDETCMNRQTQYLCHPKHCPCGERCTNVQFGKRKAIRTDVHWYGPRGYGLRALERIPKDHFIDEYRGEVISYNEMVRRVRDHYKDTGNYYFLMYDAPAGEMLDGGLRGNITRFANHSCDPNCKIQKWLVCGTDEQRAGEFQVALFAKRDIEAGEELTYDYGWSAFSPRGVTDDESTTAETCHCGSFNCSGFLGVKKAPGLPKAPEVFPLIEKDEKKKRGRPRKTPLLEHRSTSTFEGVLVASPISTSSLAQNTPLLLPQKRGPGRPRKIVQQGLQNPLLGDKRYPGRLKGLGQGKVRRKPGRPKKGTKKNSIWGVGGRSLSRPSKAPRIYVRDRVSYSYVPPNPSKLIDSSQPPVVTGKRTRQRSGLQ